MAKCEMARVGDVGEPLSGFLCLDEMKGNISRFQSPFITLKYITTVQENIVVKDGKLIGFVNSYLDAKCTIATHILGNFIFSFGKKEFTYFLNLTVFYLRTIRRELSLPVAWYPTSTCSPTQMAIYFWEILHECERNGIAVQALVADGASQNRRLFNMLAGVSSAPMNGPHTAPNPYAAERPIYLCSDTSHLLKVRVCW